MITDAARPMTERQRAVMERIDRRLPIKLIAHELGVSETRINQHIRALKDGFDVHSLNDLVEAYRASGQAPAQDDSAEEGAQSPLGKPAYRNAELGVPGESGDDDGWVDAEDYLFADAVQLPLDGPWRDDPRIVPGVLDGKNAVLFRLAVIVGITFASAASLILLVSVALGLSEVIGG